MWRTVCSCFVGEGSFLFCRERSDDRVTDAHSELTTPGHLMTPSIVLEYIMLLCSRSKLQARLGLYVEAAKDFPQWSTLESTLTLVVNGLGSLPSMQGASMVTFVWVTS